MNATTVKMQAPAGTPKAGSIFFPDGSQADVASDGSVLVPLRYQSFALNAGFTPILSVEAFTPLTVSTATVAASMVGIPAGYGSTIGYADATLQDGTKVALPYLTKN